MQMKASEREQFNGVGKSQRMNSLYKLKCFEQENPMKALKSLG